MRNCSTVIDVSRLDCNYGSMIYQYDSIACQLIRELGFTIINTRRKVALCKLSFLYTMRTALTHGAMLNAADIDIRRGWASGCLRAIRHKCDTYIQCYEYSSISIGTTRSVTFTSHEPSYEGAPWPARTILSMISSCSVRLYVRIVSP